MNGPLSRAVALVAIWWGAFAVAAPAGAQEHRYTLGIRGAALDTALEQFVEATGLAISYDPRLVQGQRAYCAARDEPAEALLQCILRESRLDFYRLSSGTYVVTEPAESPSRPGFIAGTVVDFYSRAPLTDAHVQLVDLGAGVLTNRSGQFVFPPLLPGEYVLRISHVGYKTWRETVRVEADGRSSALAALKPETVFITPVIVDARTERLSSRLGEGSVESGFGLARVTAEPDPHYVDLNQLPGVRLNDATSDVHIQGADAGAHELRLDGVPVYVPRSMFGLIGPFAGFALSTIMVEKAGFDASRGSHAAGVILAEHAIDGRPGVDVQVDPLSINARLRGAASSPAGRSATFMAAARTSFWGIRAPRAIHNMLETWSRPDPFLAFAAMSLPADSAQTMWTNFSPDAPTVPDLAFSDVHAAMRLRLNPLQTVGASGYYGSNAFSGGSAIPGIGHANADVAPGFTLLDGYAWENRLGQVRYDAIVGNRTLFGLQIRGSQYRLQHRYNQLPFPYSVASVPVSVDDANEMNTIAAESVLDHVRGNNVLRSGLEVQHMTSSFSLSDIRLTYLDAHQAYRDQSPSWKFSSLSGRSRTWRASAFLQNERSLSRSTRLEAGVRLTYVPEQEETYAEPRAALYHDRQQGPFGAWSSRSAAGVYRQFVNQLDVSRYSVGALLPTVRIWLPIDASLRPPLVYHFSQSFVFVPHDGWQVNLEAYYKHQPHGIVATYYRPGTEAIEGLVPEQALYLAGARSRGRGASASVRWNDRWTRVEAQYEYSRVVQRSEVLFSGRAHTVPWNEPHRADLKADWAPFSRFTFVVRARAVWGVSWGLSQSYYDYFGHGPSTQLDGDLDLSRPSDHVLPSLYQVDVGAAYTQPLTFARLQVRADVVNLFDRRNVAEWRLTPHDGLLHREPRLLYPRLVSLAVRVTI